MIKRSSQRFYLKESLRTIVYEELYKLEDREREDVSAYLLSTGVYSRKSATQR